MYCERAASEYAGFLDAGSRHTPGIPLPPLIVGRHEMLNAHVWTMRNAPRCIYAELLRRVGAKRRGGGLSRHVVWQLHSTHRSHYTALHLAQSHSSDSDEGNIHQLLSAAS